MWIRDEAFVSIQRHSASIGCAFVIRPECFAVVVNAVSVAWIGWRCRRWRKQSERNGCDGDDRYAKDSDLQCGSLSASAIHG